MNKSTIILVASILLGLVISFFVGERHGTKKGLAYGKPDTVTVTRWIHDSIPYPVDSIIYKTKLVYLPIHDTTETHDTTEIHDSVLVEVPIVEKVYTGANYKATVRGFQPELVDIWIRQKETVIAIPHRKRWSFTVGPQAGVGYTPKGWQPYAGAGLTFGYTF